MEFSAVQLNAWHFAHYEPIKQYLADQQADIVFLQEAATGILSSHPSVFDPCATVAQELGYNLAYGPRYGCENEVGTITGQMGCAILSKHPIASYYIHYIQETGPYRILSEQESRLALGVTTNDDEKAASYTIDQSLPSCIVECIIDLRGALVQCLTTKFPASGRGGHNEAMNNHYASLATLVRKSSLPVIVGLDANTTPQSDIIFHLDQVLERGPTIGNTLNSRLHSGFKNGIPPAGLEVDYLYTKNIPLQSYTKVEVDISDHLPIKAVYNIVTS